MDKRTLMISVLAGLMFGQLFAGGDGPIQISNTVRFGYDDNLYKRDKDNQTETAFISDIIDLSGRISFSDRTALLAKARLTARNDTAGTVVSPELSAVLSHTVSPRLLMRLSENYRSGDSSGTTGASALNESKRYTYYDNRVGVSADYVLTEKDRLEGSLDYDILRYEDDEKRGTNDTTTVEAGTSWKHDIIQQRTYSTLNVRQRWVDYDHRDSSFEATDVTAGLNHTFNPKFQGSVEGGFTQIRPDYPAPASNDSSISPLVRVGLSYSPSPRTRISGDFGHSYVASADSSYGGQTTTDLRFGVQHDITAKLMAKATARFAKTDSSAKDNTTTTNTANTEDRMDFDFRLTYKLNRMHFIDVGVKHSEVASEKYADWKQNMIDVGWRVDFN
jgi:hypothetical protein